MSVKRPWYAERVQLTERDGTISKPWSQYFRQLPQFVWNEAPSGTIDGANKKFTLASAPNPTESLRVRQRAAAATSWTVMALTTGFTYAIDATTGKPTVTFVGAPAAGSILEVDYTTILL
jgi:hypothetical protein